MAGIRMVMFDLAGTTVVDDNAVANCLYQAAREVGLEASADEIARSVGTNKIDLYRMLVARSRGRDVHLRQMGTITVSPKDEALAHHAFERYEHIMLEHYRTHTHEIPGTSDTFRWLKARGIKIATDTGFHKNINRALMDRLGWLRDGLIDAALDVEDVTGQRGRPAPYMIFRAMEMLGIDSVHDVIKVGDQPADLLEGYHAGCRGVIAVLSGPMTAATLGAYRHTHMIPSVADLPALFEKEFLQ